MTRMLPDQIRKALTDAVPRLRSIYGARLEKVVLFGSYARGDYAPGSDIDLLIVLDRIDDVAAERERYLPVVYETSLSFDVVLSIIPVTLAAFEYPETPLLLNVQREGVEV